LLFVADVVTTSLSFFDFWVSEGSFISSFSYFVYNILSLVEKSRRPVALIEITVEVGVAK
jgi:hypothetical protein